MAFRANTLLSISALLLATYTSADLINCAQSGENCDEQSNPHTCCEDLYCKKPVNPTVTDQPGVCTKFVAFHCANGKCVKQDGSCGGKRINPDRCCDGLECVGKSLEYDGPGLCKPTGSKCSAKNTACRINDTRLDCCKKFTCKTPNSTFTSGTCQ